MSSAKDFGVQSYCFREFKDNAVVAEKVRQIGVDRIELCGVHVDFHDLKAFEQAVATYRAAGVEVVSIGVNTFTGDPSEEDWFRCVQLAGARHLSCHFQPESFLRAIPQVRRWARDYGVRVGIHCHGGYDFNGNVATLQYLLGLGAPEIGICIDTAWAMQTGPVHGNPVDWIRRHFPGQVTGIHYKDFLFERDGMWKDVVVGTGNLDLPGVVQALEDTGFDGVAVIEYEADPADPVPALTACVQRMRAAIG